MEGALIELAKLGGSIAAILFLFWLARRLDLGGDLRIRDEAHARALADEVPPGPDGDTWQRRLAPRIDAAQTRRVLAETGLCGESVRGPRMAT